MKTHLPQKNCLLCGRPITWRKKWEKNWDEVKYCSDRCRSSKNSKNQNFDQKILDLLKTRSRESTICPSEVLPAEQKSDTAIMEQVRQAARRLANSGLIEICQKGQVVDSNEFRGPIRLRTKR